MLINFAYVFIFLVIAAGFVFVTLIISHLVSPHNPTPGKRSVYECGEIPFGKGVIQFNMRFYLITFVFVIFDVEIALMFPVTSVFLELLNQNAGVLAFVEIAVFVCILMVGFIYAWSQGGLDWVRASDHSDRQLILDNQQ